MTDTDKDNLLYRPELEPERHYESESVFTHEEPIEEVPVYNSPTYEPDKIREDLNQIIELIDSLPPDVRFYKEIVQKVVDRLDIAFPPGTPSPYYVDPTYYNQENPNEEYVPQDEMLYSVEHPVSYVKDKDPNDPDLPDFLPHVSPININMKTPETMFQMVQDAYSKDQIHLDAYYNQKLQLTMQDYFQNMFMTMAGANVSNLNDLTRDFDGETVKIPSGKNLEHLRDEIVRSQNLRKSKTKVMRKTHSADKTLIHMRAWKAAADQRARYYKEEYGGSASYLENQANFILQQNREKYDENYKMALYNMYKYLDSSVMMISDALDMTVMEAQAKGALLKENVNIFETKEAEEALAMQAAQQAASGQAQSTENSGSSSLLGELGLSGSSSSESSSDSSGSVGGVIGQLTGNLDQTLGSAITGIMSKPTSSSDSSLLGTAMQGIGGGFGGGISGNSSSNVLSNASASLSTSLNSMTSSLKGQVKTFASNQIEQITNKSGDSWLGKIAKKAGGKLSDLINSKVDSINIPEIKF